MLLKQLRVRGEVVFFLSGSPSSKTMISLCKRTLRRLDFGPGCTSALPEGRGPGWLVQGVVQGVVGGRFLKNTV